MLRCFLSYNGSYKPTMEIIRRLLETLEFQVDVSDSPDLDRPPASIVQQRISSADCLVLLLGPAQREPAGNQSEPAPWPVEEGLFAASRPIPLALILHPGTRVPNMIGGQQTPARFDFWDQVDLVNNIHHVVKHLLDLKRRVDLPPGDQPFLYTRAIYRNRIQRDGTVINDIYHEAVARQECSRFHHYLDTGMDHRPCATISLASADAFEVQATLNPGRHDVSIQFQEITPRQIPYVINVEPPLLPGERLGYHREFEVNCEYPLTRQALLNMASEEGFPSLYKMDGKVFYGDVYDVTDEMESFTLAFHFPRKIRLLSWRALAFSMTLKVVNVLETERCNASFLSLEESPESPEKILSLQIRRPLVNHNYALLYEPG
jgi:hypothetical protein